MLSAFTIAKIHYLGETTLNYKWIPILNKKTSVRSFYIGTTGQYLSIDLSEPPTKEFLFEDNITSATKLDGLSPVGLQLVGLSCYQSQLNRYGLQDGLSEEEDYMDEALWESYQSNPLVEPLEYEDDPELSEDEGILREQTEILDVSRQANLLTSKQEEGLERNKKEEDRNVKLSEKPLLLGPRDGLDFVPVDDLYFDKGPPVNHPWRKILEEWLFLRLKLFPRVSVNRLLFKKFLDISYPRIVSLNVPDPACTRIFVHYKRGKSYVNSPNTVIDRGPKNQIDSWVNRDNKYDWEEYLHGT